MSNPRIGPAAICRYPGGGPGNGAFATGGHLKEIEA